MYTPYVVAVAMGLMAYGLWAHGVCLYFILTSYEYRSVCVSGVRRQALRVRVGAWCMARPRRGGGAS